jgi:hypothetical protein
VPVLSIELSILKEDAWKHVYFILSNNEMRKYFYQTVGGPCFQVLEYVASLLEMPESELAELSYKNATKLFSYPGSKVQHEPKDI